MSASGESSNPAPKPPNNSTVILLLGTIAGTTWRMFVPTLGFIGIGFWGDNEWNTKPWLTILGIIAGTLVAALLIRKQLNDVKETK